MTYVLISVVKSKVYLIDRSSGLNVTLKNVGEIWEFCIHVTKEVASNERLALATINWIINDKKKNTLMAAILCRKLQVQWIAGR